MSKFLQSARLLNSKGAAFQSSKTHTSPWRRNGGTEPRRRSPAVQIFSSRKIAYLEPFSAAFFYLVALHITDIGDPYFLALQKWLDNFIASTKFDFFTNSVYNGITKDEIKQMKKSSAFTMNFWYSRKSLIFNLDKK